MNLKMPELKAALEAARFTDVRDKPSATLACRSNWRAARILTIRGREMCLQRAW